MLCLRYQIGLFKEISHHARGTVGTISLPADVGVWRRFTLVPRDDVARLWPELVAEDNSLTRFGIGVNGAGDDGAGFVVDRLTFTRSRRRRAGQAGEAMRAEIVGAYAGAYGDVEQFLGYEISLARHLNWFGGDQTLPPFPSPPVRDDDAGHTAAMVKFLHAHGGLVSWNHPMDIEQRDSLAKLMIERDALGVDLVEIGRRPPAGAVLEIVTGTVDETGLTPSTSVRAAARGQSVSVTPGHYLRTQVRMPDKAVVGASNPLWLLAKRPKRAVPADLRRSLPRSPLAGTLPSRPIDDML